MDKISEAILPSGPGAAPLRWSADHLRLHRSLLQQPTLLPRGASLLLAVSGGQDSMAMTGLLCDLQARHQWRLHLWHGDHGWRPESARQARELQLWARERGLDLLVERQPAAQAAVNREASARHWRYSRLRRSALRLGCSHVLTAHTASDRAETVLLNLARGSHQRGLAGLRRRLPLDALLEHGGAETVGPSSGSAAPADVDASGSPPNPAAAAAQADRPGPLWLVRPLQPFSRQDTLRLCRNHAWPVWQDPSNDQLTLSRNRIRARVLPELEALHPGAIRRISEQADRLAAEQEQQGELLDLALGCLALGPLELDRRALLDLSSSTQGLVLQHWLHRCCGRGLESRALASLLSRLPLRRGPGCLDLAGPWQLRWRGTTLALRPLQPPSCGHG